METQSPSARCLKLHQIEQKMENELETGMLRMTLNTCHKSQYPGVTL